MKILKKILIFLIVLLTGCTVIKNEYIIIINVESKGVIPNVSSSLENYRFYEDSMQFIATTTSLKPVNISFYLDGYQTENVYISPSELLEKRVERTVRFVKEKQTYLEIELLGSSKVNNYVIQGLIGYETNENKIIALVDKDKPINIKIKANGFEDTYLYISSNDLSYGFCKKQVVLNKENEVVYVFKNDLGSTDAEMKEYVSGKNVQKHLLDNGVYFILKKGYEYIYITNKKTHYVNANENKEMYIDVDQSHVNLKTFYINNRYNPGSQNHYYYFNGRFYSKTLSYSIKVPYGSELVFFESDGKVLNGYYFYTANAISDNITIEKSRANLVKPLYFDLRIYDRLNHRYITSILNNGNLIFSNEENYFTDMSILNLDDYVIMNQNYITDLEIYEDKYILDIEVIPKNLPLAIRFVDQNNKIITGARFNTNAQYLGDGVYLFKYIEEMYSYGPLNVLSNTSNIYTNISINYLDRETKIDYELYLDCFKQVYIDGMSYYQYYKDVVIDSRRINLKFEFITNSSYNNLEQYKKDFILKVNNFSYSYYAMVEGLTNLMVGDNLELFTGYYYGRTFKYTIDDSFVGKRKMIINVDNGSYTLE